MYNATVSNAIKVKTNTYSVLIERCLKSVDTGHQSRQVAAFINDTVSRPRSFTLHSLVATIEVALRQTFERSLE